MKKHILTTVVLGLVAFWSFAASAEPGCENVYRDRAKNYSSSVDLMSRETGFTTTYAVGFGDPAAIVAVGATSAVGTTSIVHDELKKGDYRKTLALIHEASVGNGLQFLMALNELKSSGVNVNASALAEVIVNANSKALFCQGEPLSYGEAMDMIKMTLQAE